MLWIVVPPLLVALNGMITFYSLGADSIYQAVINKRKRRLKAILDTMSVSANTSFMIFQLNF